MSLRSSLPESLAMGPIGKRFAEAEQIADRDERWAAQAAIAIETGDLYLVGLVLFKTIQEFGLHQFADLAGETPVRLQKLWMPGMLPSLDHAVQLFERLGVRVAREARYAAMMAGFPAPGASVH